MGNDDYFIAEKQRQLYQQLQAGTQRGNCKIPNFFYDEFLKLKPNKKLLLLKGVKL